MRSTSATISPTAAASPSTLLYDACSFQRKLNLTAQKPTIRKQSAGMQTKAFILLLPYCPN